MEDVGSEGFVLALCFPLGFVLCSLRGVGEGGFDLCGNHGEEVLRLLLCRCGRLVVGRVLETDTDSSFIESADTCINTVGFRILTLHRINVGHWIDDCHTFPKIALLPLRGRNLNVYKICYLWFYFAMRTCRVVTEYLNIYFVQTLDNVQKKCLVCQNEKQRNTDITKEKQRKICQDILPKCHRERISKESLPCWQRFVGRR